MEASTGLRNNVDLMIRLYNAGNGNSKCVIYYIYVSKTLLMTNLESHHLEKLLITTRYSHAKNSYISFLEVCRLRMYIVNGV